jgi:hypothetical protein
MGDMWKTIWAFIKELVRDGYAILGIVAAPLSISFTLAKAFDVQALGHLKEVSYAWALAPLTLWFFVAYVRRRAADMGQPTMPRPDLKIRELFYYIRPDDLLNNNSWEAVGNDVMDKLATGQLIAWGRRGRGRPLQPINMTFWPEAGLTDSFLAPDHDDDEHARNNAVLTVNESYNDVRMYSVHVSRIWPS